MNIITTLDQLNELVSYYSNVDAFAFDVETMGDTKLDPRQNRVVWISLATHDRVDVIPMGHPNGVYTHTEYPLLPSGELRSARGVAIREADYIKDERKAVYKFTAPPEQLTAGEVFKALKPLFFSDKLKVGHNLKFDLQSVAKYIVGLPSPRYACTLNASFILDNQNRLNLGLDDCLKRELGYNMVKGVGKSIENHSFQDVANYAGLDAEWTWKLWVALDAKLKSDKLDKLFLLEMDVLEVICHMEQRGADIDVKALSILKTNLDLQIETTKASIYRIAGKAFNINSVKEKQALLFTPKSEGGRGLKGKVFTPAGEVRVNAGSTPTVNDYSVATPALAPFLGKDLLVNSLAEYSDTNKLLTTYVVPYLGGDITKTVGGKEKIVAKQSILLNNRIHTDFVQYGTETGRLSSRNPNLQNVPSPKTVNGKAIRNLFVAPEGHSLVVADYSQIEPRVVAAFSQDRVMLDNYTRGGDVYVTIGDTMGITRSAGKTLFLSLTYGVGPDKVAESVGCSLSDAKYLLESFNSKFSSVLRYKSHVVTESRKQSPVPYVSTYLGRRRYLPDLRSREMWKRSRAERQAFNTKIQGSAADIIKIAMVRAHNLLPEGSYLILTVHDELVTVTPNEQIDETVNMIRLAMEGIQAISVPLVADIKVVSRWGEAK